ncbi:MAG TPA: MGMT family protein [Anaerolineales bacterium]|nr:MGMT family protein [Anaerolineales bacterium]
MVKYSSIPNKELFHQKVWDVVRQVPFGRVTTYGTIASLIPPPGGMNPRSYDAFAPRWVGGAMAACPDNVPWHRVINSQGKISQRESAELQRILLEEEGVLFDDRGKVDLKIFGWNGSLDNTNPK